MTVELVDACVAEIERTHGDADFCTRAGMGRNTALGKFAQLRARLESGEVFPLPQNGGAQLVTAAFTAVAYQHGGKATSAFFEACKRVVRTATSGIKSDPLLRTEREWAIGHLDYFHTNASLREARREPVAEIAELQLSA